MKIKMPRKKNKKPQFGYVGILGFMGFQAFLMNTPWILFFFCCFGFFTFFQQDSPRFRLYGLIGIAMGLVMGILGLTGIIKV